MTQKQSDDGWVRIEKDLGKLVEHVNTPAQRSNPPPPPTPAPKESPDTRSKTR